MTNNSMSILKTLRKAAYNREWTTLQSATQEAFSQLETFMILEIIIKYVQAYLPTFEKYHPPEDDESARVLRELAVTVVSFGFAPERLPDFLTTEFDSPGSGQFANATLEMCRAMQKERTGEERLQYFTSAIANVFLAELSEIYYSRYPEDFKRVRENTLDPDTGEYTDPEAAQIPIKFWMHPLVEARDTTLWLRLADDLEEKLKELS